MTCAGQPCGGIGRTSGSGWLEVADSRSQPSPREPVIQAPLSVMRFDESVYRMLGDHLLGLTAERDFILDPSTYHERSTGSSRLPGALVEGFNFTL